MPRLLLVRHGQSLWNAQGRWQGQADPPLTELGEQQARAAVDTLSQFGIETIVTSALQRAMRTGDLLAQGLGLAEPRREPMLNERSAGEWSGFTRAEIEQQWPGYLASGQRPPGYENDDELLPRVLEGLAVVNAMPGGQKAAVAHGGVVYVLEEHFGYEFAHLANLGARWVEFDDAGTVTGLGERVPLLTDDVATTPNHI